jgi:hypothetical protein
MSCNSSTKELQNNNIIKNKINEFFDILNNNTIKLLFAKNRENLYQYEIEIMRNIKNSDIECLFRNLLIAEFKEKVYECIYFPHVKKIEVDHTFELKRIIINYYGEDILFEHIHDPTHFIFENQFYMFYEMIEAKGRNILDEWYDD